MYLLLHESIPAQIGLKNETEVSHLPREHAISAAWSWSSSPKLVIPQKKGAKSDVDYYIPVLNVPHDLDRVKSELMVLGADSPFF